jgi:hypothetical protein
MADLSAYQAMVVSSILFGHDLENAKNGNKIYHNIELYFTNKLAMN